MLTGHFEVMFDKAGRMTVPSRHRAQLAEDVLVCPALPPERHLLVYDSRAFQEFLDGLFRNARITEDEEDLVRRVAGSAFDAPMDKAGRILVPQTLRERAGIDGTAVAVGVVDHLELWSPSRYEEWVRQGETPEYGQKVRDVRTAMREELRAQARVGR
jgi:MraZ protein